MDTLVSFLMLEKMFSVFPPLSIILFVKLLYIIFSVFESIFLFLFFKSFYQEGR